jgi:hypothetical protein
LSVTSGTARSNKRSLTPHTRASRKAIGRGLPLPIASRTRLSARMSSASVQCTSTGRLALGLQAVEHAQRTRDLAGEHGLAELEDVVARHVQHRRLDLLEAQLAGRVQQASFWISWWPRAGCPRRGRRRTPASAGPARRLARAGLCAEPLRDPLRQALRSIGSMRTATPGAVERG